MAAKAGINAIKTWRITRWTLVFAGIKGEQLVENCMNVCGGWYFFRKIYQLSQYYGIFIR
jgi:hypothetical protein